MTASGEREPSRAYEVQKIQLPTFESIYQEIVYPRKIHYDTEHKRDALRIPKLDIEEIPTTIRIDAPRFGGHREFILQIAKGAQGHWNRQYDFSVVYGVLQGTNKPLLIGSVHKPERSSFFGLLLGDYPGKFSSFENYVSFWASFNTSKYTLNFLVGDWMDKKDFVQAVKINPNVDELARNAVKDLNTFVDHFLPIRPRTKKLGAWTGNRTRGLK